MYPRERSLVQKYANRPFALLGVNSDEDLKKLKARMAEERITWRSWRNGGKTSGPISSRWNISGWPTTYVIDHKGIIRHRDLTGKRLDQALEQLIAEAEAATEH